MKRTFKLNSGLLIFTGLSVIIAVELLFHVLFARLLAYTLCPICIILGCVSWTWTLELSEDGIQQNAMWKNWSYRWNEIDCAVIKPVDNGYSIRLFVPGGEVIVHTVFIDAQVVEIIKKNCRVI